MAEPAFKYRLGVGTWHVSQHLSSLRNWLEKRSEAPGGLCPTAAPSLLSSDIPDLAQRAPRSLPRCTTALPPQNMRAPDFSGTTAGITKYISLRNEPLPKLSCVFVPRGQLGRTKKKSKLKVAWGGGCGAEGLAPGEGPQGSINGSERPECCCWVGG